MRIQATAAALIGACLSLSAFGAPDLPRPTFRVSFDGSLTPERAAGKTQHTALTTEETAYVDGHRGKAVLLGDRPPIVYQAYGNVPDEATVSVWVKPMEWASIEKWRYLLSVIPQGRSIVFLAHYPRRKPILQFLWTPRYSPGHESTEKTLEMNAWNHVAVSWDGVRSNVYFNGERVLTKPHPSGFQPHIPEKATLQLGGILPGVSSGSSYASEPWGAADTAVDELTVYPGVLSAAQIAALAGKQIDMRKRQGPSDVPQSVCLPKTRTSPVINGRLADGEWHQTLRLPPLIDGNRPGTSFDCPPQDIYLAYDEANLYLALQVKFPPGAQVPRGGTRDGLEDDDEQVWDDESFELWLLRPGEEKTYRFAGNVAGGFTEMFGKDKTWNGEWSYRSTVSMSIRSNEVWQAEAAIPWATLGMTAAATTEMRINVCRTWRSLDQLRVTSLGGAPGYPDTAVFARMHLAPEAPAMLFESAGSPSAGETEQGWLLRNLSDSPLQVDVAVTLVADVPASDRTALRTTVTLPPGAEKHVSATIAVDDASFQRLNYELAPTNGPFWLRYSVPFELRADFLDVIPILSEDAVVVRPALNLFRKRLQTKGEDVDKVLLKLIDPAGKTVTERDVTEEGDLRLTLPENGPPGEYRAQLVAMGGDGETAPAERRFTRPPRPPWLETPDQILERVLPPFEPLDTQVDDMGAISIGCWGRTVRFHNALLPTVIESKGAGNLLAEPLALELGGQVAPAATVTLTRRSDVRDELRAVTRNDRAEIHNDTWIEYDGVMVHRITVHAKTDIEHVSLRIPMQTEYAQYGHFASGGFGAGGGFTKKIDGELATGFYPVVWLGNFERGLAWFCEGGRDIRPGTRKPIDIGPGDKVTTMRVRLWNRIQSGETVALRFGFVATPVKPLHPRYPLNIFARNALWDDPPTVPLYASVVWNPRNFFQDIRYYDNTRREVVTAGDLLRESDQQTDAKLMPYMTPYTLTSEYPAARHFKREWEIVPVRHDDSPSRQVSQNQSVDWTEFWMSPGSESYRRYYAWKFGQTLQNTGMEAVYFDFGCAFPDSNVHHGAHGGFPLLGMRDFYRRIANEFVKTGVDDYAIVSHNSQAIQIPAMTFVTHFYNGEHLRTSSSPALHEGRDYLDTLPLHYFGIEQSGLPWGIHGNMLVEFDEAEHLIRRLGVTDETVTEYLWKRTPSVVMPILLHGCLPDGYRLSLPYYKSVVASLHAFDIPSATFHPYWRNADRIDVDHEQVRVSAYARPEAPRLLLVVGNLSPDPVETDITLDLNQFYNWEDSPLRGMKRVEKKGDLLQVRELVGARDARLINLAPNTVSLWIRGHAMALVEVSGHIRIR